MKCYYALVVVPPGGVCFTAGSDKVIKKWDIDSGLLLQELDGHEDQVSVLAFSPARPPNG